MKDSEFIRGEVPMTKEEIRAIVLSKLELSENDSFVDIGAGTGSVCVELAKKILGKVFAIEQKPEAVDLIYRNIEKHKIENIEVVEGEALDVLPLIPQCNKVFIGGSGNSLSSILDWAVAQLPLGGIIVVNAIVLDTAYEAYHYFRKQEYFEAELIQVGVNKLKEIGSKGMLLAQNPIFIITARKV